MKGIISNTFVGKDSDGDIELMRLRCNTGKLPIRCIWIYKKVCVKHCYYHRCEYDEHVTWITVK